MAELEREVSGICRQKDYRYFIENREGIWGSLVYQGPQGIEGFMFSSKHPASNMVGPVMRTEQQAASLLLAALIGIAAGRRCSSRRSSARRWCGN